LFAEPATTRARNPVGKNAVKLGYVTTENIAVNPLQITVTRRHVSMIQMQIAFGVSADQHHWTVQLHRHWQVTRKVNAQLRSGFSTRLRKQLPLKGFHVDTNDFYSRVDGSIQFCDGFAIKSKSL
jgi:hypothetical protein